MIQYAPVDEKEEKKNGRGKVVKTKILAFAAAATIASIANAGVLYWQVNNSPDTVTDVDGNQPITEVQSAYENWDYAALVKYDNEVSDQANASGGTAVTSTPANSSGVTGAGFISKSQLADWEAAAANMDSYSSGYFYVELFNSSTGDRVGRSGEYLQMVADGNGGYKLVNSSGSDFLSTSQFTVDSVVWNGGSSYVAVPEPTSGVMLLLGAAALGLRRKRRA